MSQDCQVEADDSGPWVNPGVEQGALIDYPVEAAKFGFHVAILAPGRDGHSRQKR